MLRIPCGYYLEYRPVAPPYCTDSEFQVARPKNLCLEQSFSGFCMPDFQLYLLRAAILPEVVKWGGRPVFIDGHTFEQKDIRVE